ncbi:DegQ family serine endoprotease [Paraglaciecola chathamensis]|jgi:Do/DeqQ family serine protease|uniref:Serine endoprotease DegQ n=2 Tax=Paraglaciecola chathamensis TaxID=368405 RepID=A0A8H9M2I7_9ALTE|nr:MULTISPECIES: DegQ family serine endoprotease [Paraglaciecola]MBN24723.1 serine endoprotease DegQ [Alteromonadaceae bacterium]GAC11419.1 probable periplasmic serine protease do/hhoA-like [Paraglaciecola chathamensis S18K6]GGZ52798.1 serine endoprotease DegQ [Paraglaciecola oceanifecundans]|tara:strand:+ start:11003 stop:12373 length:1371 start_codon:yes stop_codon:yes gene_type:complete
MSKVINRTVITSCVFAASLMIAGSASAALPFFSSDNEPVTSLAPMLEKTTPGIVTISVEGTQVSRQQVPEMFRRFFGGNGEQVQERPFKGLGSGVIIDADKGYIVTNNHVVDNADEITVKLNDGREVKAKKLGADEQSDIALLKVDSDNLNLVAVPLADSDKVRVGDFVVAIGNPFGLSQTVTSGIVSALGRSGLNIGGYENFIQTDAAINRGNSGGALVSLNGELVGINTAIFGPNGGNVGIGFAIPANMMKSLVDQIIEFGEVRRGLLGILGQDVDSGLAEAMNLDVSRGAFVSEVNEGSAADIGGIQAGDIIIEIEGRPVTSFLELRAKIGSKGAGTKVNLTLLRKGKEKDVQVTLGDATQSTVAAKEIHPALEGATLTNGKTKQGVDGVVISELTARSPSALIGLQDGDVIIGVNRHKIDNVIDLRNALDEAKGVIALNVKRGVSTLYLVIR